MSRILELPLPLEVYNQLPISLKLLSWHTSPETLGQYALWLAGQKTNVSVKAFCLWLQDYTGIPEIANWAAQRDGLAALGKNPSVITAKVKTHMVIDHSVRTLGTEGENIIDEYRLNFDRYRLAKWASKQLGIDVIPPGKGVIHQVNTEVLLPVFDETGFPVFGKGTDSHSPMVNALGILAWGVGGTEAQKAFAGEYVGMALPKVFGVRLVGKLPETANASDLGLYLKKALREVGVTGAFVEFFGEGVDTLPLESRATLANVSAEYGSRVAMFGIDEETVKFLALSNRDADVEELAKAYGLWRGFENEENVVRTRVVDIDLSQIKPAIAGPDQPHNWVPLDTVQTQLRQVFAERGIAEQLVAVEDESGQTHEIPNGALVLAYVASCTQTGNPDAVLRGALFAKNAVLAGLVVKPWVKTGFAAGSPLADRYLDALGLRPYLQQLGFDITAHGCGACIGQSGGLNALGKAFIAAGGKPTSIASTNRNYGGRQDANVPLSFIGRPDLVMAFAIAGRIDVNIEEVDLGDGVFLADLMPSEQEIADAKRVINKQMYADAYAGLFEGGELWDSIAVTDSPLYDWPEGSVTVKKPPFFDGLSPVPAPVADLTNARILGIFGNGFSTDAISPAGEAFEIPAAVEYLRSMGVTNPADVVSIGGYRANDDMLAATIFSNPTNQNKMVVRKGGWTVHYPSNDEGTIFSVAKRYRTEDVSQIVIAGKDYGCGSSRVMAASGPWMLGVRAVIAESFEAIHRANLWQMGVVPFVFEEGVTAETLGLDGSEAWNIPLSQITQEGGSLNAIFTRTTGESTTVTLVIALESPQEFEFLIHGGSMQKQMRELAAAV